MSPTSHKTQVGIIGAGPAGLTLALLLHRAGISCVILELRTRQYAEGRVRAGLLEQNTVTLFNELGVAGRLNKEGLKHHGVFLSFDEERIRIPFDELTGGRCITIYGQQEIVKDLIKACLDKGIEIHFEAEAKQITGSGVTHLLLAISNTMHYISLTVILLPVAMAFTASQEHGFLRIPTMNIEKIIPLAGWAYSHMQNHRVKS
jgi:2-polyprenyl-6-methoxyphenol hydroxylase-like FAD-dependent oxidoreductase